MQSDIKPHSGAASHVDAASLAEWRIIQPILRAVLPIALITLLGAGLGLYQASLSTPVHPVRAELLIQIGYEYTPVPSGSGGEYQQVTFRADEVIGTEIQILTSPAVIERVLEKVPHPGTDPAESEAVDGLWETQAIQRKIAVRRVEGSNVVVIDMTDPEENWAAAFLGELLAVYLSERDRLFSQQDYVALLKDRAQELQAAQVALEAEYVALSRQVSQAIAALTEEVASRPGTDPTEGGKISADLLALRLFIAGLGDQRALVEILSRQLDADQPIAVPPANWGAPGETVADQATRGISGRVDRVAHNAARLVDLSAQRQALRDQSASLQAARLRIEMRNEASRNVTVLTPPRRLANPTGPSVKMAVALSALVAFVLACLLFVFLAGVRRAPAPRSDIRDA